MTKPAIDHTQQIDIKLTNTSLFFRIEGISTFYSSISSLSF